MEEVVEEVIVVEVEGATVESDVKKEVVVNGKVIVAGGVRS